jgi:hypothetical protein
MLRTLERFVDTHAWERPPQECAIVFGKIMPKHGQGGMAIRHPALSACYPC